jgi:hypothetical protein
MKLRLFFLIIIIASMLKAQKAVDISFAMPEPFPTTVAELENADITLVIKSDIPQDYDIFFKLSLQIDDLNGNNIVNATYPKETVGNQEGIFNLPAHGIKTFNNLNDFEALGIRPSFEDVEGLTEQQVNALLSSGKLPEGRYIFCIAAYDAATGTQLSGTVCTNTGIISNGSIQLNLSSYNNIHCDSKSNYQFDWSYQGTQEIQYCLPYKVHIVELSEENGTSNIQDALAAIRSGNTIPGESIVEESETPSFTFNNLSDEKFIEDEKEYLIIISLDPTKNGCGADLGENPFSNYAIVKFNCNGEDKEEEDPNTACLANCIVDPKPSGTGGSLGINTEYKIGLFKLFVTSVSPNPPYSGTGTVDIPFLNAKLLCTFSDVQVNSDKVITFGTVKGINQGPILISGSYPTDQEGEAIISHINATGKLVSGLTGQETSLPIGYSNGQVTIGITQVEFYPTEAKMAAALIFEAEWTNGWLSIGADNILFHPKGFNTGGGRIFSPQDKRITIGDNVLILNKCKDQNDTTGTYVKWNCQGFEELHLAGKFQFSKKLLVAEDKASGTLKEDTTVSVNFSINVRDINDILINASPSTPFQMKVLNDWGFEMTDLWLDLSPNKNPDKLIFPVNYTGTKDESWNGFYANSIAVRLPKSLGKKDQARIEFSANSMIIDHTGITTNFNASNILNSGLIAGWKFSIDSIQLRITQSNFDSSSMKGNIHLPVCNDNIPYKMILAQNEQNSLDYQFIVGGENNIEVVGFDEVQAKLMILNTSSIQLNYVSEKFEAKASLNMTFGFESFKFLGKNKIKLEGLTVSSSEPHFENGTFSFASPQHMFFNNDEDKNSSMSGFPISLTNVSIVLRTVEEELNFGIQMTAGLTLGETEAEGNQTANEKNTFSSSVSFAILFKMGTGEDGEQKIKFSTILVDTVKVAADNGAVKFNASLVFFHGDAVYGNGFMGEADVEVIKMVTVSAFLYFGQKEDLTYFAVGGNATLPQSIVLFPGLGLKGFGGGLAYHMRIQERTQFNDAVIYQPDAETLFGVYAQAQFDPGVETPQGTATPYFFNVGVGAEFSEHEGIKNLKLFGDVYVMTKIENVAPDPNKSDFYGKLDATMSFESKEFGADFDMFVNAARVNNEPTVKGSHGTRDGVSGYAGNIHMYFSPTKWNVLVGIPNERISVTTGIKEINFEINGYLMIGSEIPEMGGFPKEVQDFMNLDQNPKVNAGAGFAFGAEIRFNAYIGDNTTHIDAECIAGLNLAVMNTIKCSNRDKIGINGWYALGNLYLYTKGNAVVCGTEVASLEAGLTISGGLPDPTYLDINGKIAFKVLLWDGEAEFHAFFGEKCPYRIESPVANLPLITGLTPDDNSNGISPFIYPELAVNIGDDKEIELWSKTADGKDIRKKYRLKVNKFKLYNKDNNEVEATIIHSENNKILTLKPRACLSQNSKYTLKAEVAFYEYNGASYSIAKKLDQSEIKESRAYSFETGAYPERISEDNIVASIPYFGQNYFLQGECNNPGFWLNQDLEEMIQSNVSRFNLPPLQDVQVSYFAIFEEKNNPTADPIKVPIQINKWKAPNGIQDARSPGVFCDEMPLLKNNTIYNIRFYRDETNRQQNLSNAMNRTNLLASSGIFLKTKFNLQDQTLEKIELKDQTKGYGDKEFYSFTFKTSKYNTVEAKVKNFKATRSFSATESVELEADEKLDEFDKSAIAFVQSKTHNQYYTNHIKFWWELYENVNQTDALRYNQDNFKTFFCNRTIKLSEYMKQSFGSEINNAVPDCLGGRIEYLEVLRNAINNKSIANKNSFIENIINNSEMARSLVLDNSFYLNKFDPLMSNESFTLSTNSNIGGNLSGDLGRRNNIGGTLNQQKYKYSFSTPYQQAVTAVHKLNAVSNFYKGVYTDEYLDHAIDFGFILNDNFKNDFKYILKGTGTYAKPENSKYTVVANCYYPKPFDQISDIGQFYQLIRNKNATNLSSNYIEYNIH